VSVSATVCLLAAPDGGVSWGPPWLDVLALAPPPVAGEETKRWSATLWNRHRHTGSVALVGCLFRVARDLGWQQGAPGSPTVPAPALLLVASAAAAAATAPPLP
jgi:hypothetical protein